MGEENANLLFEAFLQNDYFGWPNDISSDLVPDKDGRIGHVTDGRYAFFEVETKTGRFKKNGLNPHSEPFVICEELFLKIVNSPVQIRDILNCNGKNIWRWTHAK